jgi:hypothetical protein
VRGRDHLRPRQASRPSDSVQVETDEVWQEEKESATGGLESSRRQREGSHVGDLLDSGTGTAGAFFVQASGQRSEPLLAQELAHGGRAERQVASLEMLADFVDGVIGLAERDGQVSRSRLLGLLAGAGARRGEEAGIGIAAETVTEDLEGSGGVAEIASDLSGGAALDEESAEGFVLALSGEVGFEEETADIG